MADAHTARPVSGEIMAGMAGEAAGAAPTVDAVHDVIDADYEVLPRDNAPPPAARPPLQGTAAGLPPLGGMDMLRKPEEAPARAPASRGGPVFWVAGLGAVLAAFWISGGDALVRQAPLFAAGGEGPAAFTLSGVSSRVDASGAKSLLFVDGEAANDGSRASPLPPLKIRVTGEDGRVTSYTLGTSGRPLAPGERFTFSSRLEVPKNGVRTVSVAFAE